jgi:putative glutamine amidotransferase
MIKNKQPIIGLPCGKRVDRAGISSYDLKEAYVQALIAHDSIPLLIPVNAQLDDMDFLSEKFDGFLLSGGADVDPALYGGEPSDRVYGVDQQRDKVEIALVKTLISKNKPILAICRGVQVLNVALGGTLFTDISSQIPGAQKHDWFPGYPRDLIVHQVKLEKSSRLQQIFGGDRIETHSLHHQSLKNIAPGLKINAYAEDGIIEGVEHDSCPFLIGVQWHPEWLQSDWKTRELFHTFVEACKNP